MSSMIRRGKIMATRNFGKNKKGEDCTIYRLENRNGMAMEVSDFGATVVSLFVQDKEGNIKDVVLGYDSPIDYEGPSGTFFGATVGRNANRIGGASFELNGKKYVLEKNNGENNLHSGPDSYSFRLWNVKDTNDNSITFVLNSPDGDQGYPGAVELEVTYTLTEDNSVEISYRAVPSEDTIINLTNHSYFNLDGHASENILDHKMWLCADSFTRTNAESVPTGEIVPVEGTPMDFRIKKAIGEEIDADYEAVVLGRGYDHNWCLNNNGEYEKIAELTSEESGITMEVYTDLPGVQVYTGNYIENEKGKDGAVYQKRQGVAFETQFYPDAVHHENFPSPICKKGEIYQTKTVYKFKIDN